MVEGFIPKNPSFYVHLSPTGTVAGQGYVTESTEEEQGWCVFTCVLCWMDGWIIGDECKVN